MRPSKAAAAMILIGLSLAAGATKAAGTPIQAMDSRGRSLTLSSPAMRIVCLSPGACESLFAIGSGSTIVADTVSCDYPDQAARVPKLAVVGDAGGYAAQIAEFHPDLVVTSGDGQRDVEDRLAARGLTVFAYSPVDLDGVARSIMALGTLTGRQNTSIKTAATVSEGVRRMRTITAAIPTGRRPLVCLVGLGTTLATWGAGSLLQECLDAAGGRNAFIDAPGEGSPIVARDIVSRRPVAIVAISSRTGADGQDSTPVALSSPEWSTIPAVHSGKVFIIQDSVLSRGGPRVVTGLLILAKDLHPELFP